MTTFIGSDHHTTGRPMQDQVQEQSAGAPLSSAPASCSCPSFLALMGLPKKPQAPW